MLNKIDLPAADPERVAQEIADLIGGDPDDILKVSGKTGMGVEELLNRVVERVPAPVGDASAPARAMIFDSVYDPYRGVVTYVRMVDGRLTPREKIQMMSTKAEHEALEIGVSAVSYTHLDVYKRQLDNQLEQAMDALRTPPADAMVGPLSGGERRRCLLYTSRCV